ncbi:MAG: sigma-70 family RNA polymerase sigma factor [Abitibacteriaceae bacterium]|nr:sigma-70 family RNA polymerase sigma factor [Abditibacteriaceae bacterium]
MTVFTRFATLKPKSSTVSAPAPTSPGDEVAALVVDNEASHLEAAALEASGDDAAPVTTLSGSALAGALSTGRTAAPVSFEDVVEKYHGKVFQLVYRYTGDYEEACDLTQDTFVRAYTAWNEFRGDSQIYTWLYRIAINLCHNQQKKLTRRRRVEQVSLDASANDDNFEGWTTHQVADERPLPLQVLESGELRVRLHEALLALPDNYRTVIVLRDIEGLTYEEIARVTDSTLEAIKSRLFRARNAVRRLMEPYLIAEQNAVATSHTTSSHTASQTRNS